MHVQPSLQVPRILWGALLAAVVIYAALIGADMIKPPQPGVPPEPVMLYALSAVASMVAVVSFVLPRSLYKQTVAKIELPTVSEPQPEGFTSFYRDAVPIQKTFADPTLARRKAFATYQTPFILSLALSEAVAIFGLVIGVLGFGMTAAAPFFAAGFVLIAIRFPTERRILGPFEKGLGAVFPKK